jgi:ABC-2 type transport system permease protein
MSKVMRLAKIEGKIALRGIDGIVFGIGMPLVVLLLTNMIGGEKVIGAASYTFHCWWWGFAQQPLWGFR